MTSTVATKFDVGGVLLDRPFKIRRLGHFGFNGVKMEENLRFYTELLGFRISDEIDFSKRLPDPSVISDLGDPRGFFMRYGGDHHAFVLFNKRVMDALAAVPGRSEYKQGITINQITWQVGSLSEVGNAVPWFRENDVRVLRTGRDMPGSNWHTYVYDPDGHTNELYYGIEQVGWQGHSKPLAMYDRGFREAPELPQIAEFQEVQDALARGVDVLSGYRYIDPLPATFDVDGILLPRPFKITRIGPVNLFVDDVDASLAFYRDRLGFVVTEEATWQGHRCVFLRVNTEHHSLGLFPIELREKLGLSPHTTSMSFGLQVANYRQLRDAVDFLKGNGVTFTDAVPPELYPGMDYVAHALDADGHCIQLYYYMEQVGWDGQPRPKHLRRPVDPAAWPDRLESLSDTYGGEPYLGPWG
jgi:catechol 2,3-dioxygenase-like lactoylglutathione lyase family enzyme